MLEALVNTERKPGLGMGINYMKDFRALKSKHPRAQERISDLRRRDIRPLCVMEKLRDTSNCLLPLKALKEKKSEEVIKRKKNNKNLHVYRQNSLSTISLSPRFLFCAGYDYLLTYLLTQLCTA